MSILVRPLLRRPQPVSSDDELPKFIRVDDEYWIGLAPQRIAWSAWIATQTKKAAQADADKIKALEKGVHLEGVRLLEKSGGRSGHWRRATSAS